MWDKYSRHRVMNRRHRYISHSCRFQHPMPCFLQSGRLPQVSVHSIHFHLPHYAKMSCYLLFWSCWPVLCSHPILASVLLSDCCLQGRVQLKRKEMDCMHSWLVCFNGSWWCLLCDKWTEQAMRSMLLIHRWVYWQLPLGLNWRIQHTPWDLRKSNLPKVDPFWSLEFLDPESSVLCLFQIHQPWQPPWDGHTGTNSKMPPREDWELWANSIS
jgi:hypothetical protein